MNPNIPPYFPLGALSPFGLKEPVAGSAASCASSSDSSPTKKSANPVLGREQAKKRLLAFAQQINKTKEALQKDKVFKKWQDKYGSLKHTYIVESFEGDEKSYPLGMVKFTKTEPQISYCENLAYAKGAYKTRKEAVDAADDETKRIMNCILESSSPVSNNRYVMGRYRQWYVNAKSFIENDQVEITALQTESEKTQLPQPGPSSVEKCFEKYSPHWETDSEEEDDLPPRRPPDPVPPPKPVEVKVISKVKINKIELPFFEDEEYLESLMAGKPKIQDHQPQEVTRTSHNEQKINKVEELGENLWELSSEESERRQNQSVNVESPVVVNPALDLSAERVFEKSPVKERKIKCNEPESAEHLNKSEDVDIYDKIDDGLCQEESSLYDFIFDDRNKADESMKKKEKEVEKSPVSNRKRSPSPLQSESRRHHHRSSRSSKSRRESSSSNISRMEEEQRQKFEEAPSIPLLASYTSSAEVAEEKEEVRTFNHPGDDSFSDDDNLIKAAAAAAEAAAEKKRISLDERLEMELGFRVIEQENLPPSLTPPPPYLQEQSLDESYPTKTRPGFGPKAAPMGALIYSCPKALPLMPYIPPHLQNILYRPLVAVRPPSTPKVVKEDPAVKEESVASPTKDWNAELRTLEVVASNLEMADESVLEDLEEKLLLFETVNMVPSRDETPPPGQEVKCSVKRPKSSKRPEPPPVELKEPGKGILIMPRFLDLEEAASKRKKVVFADSINPGDGTSSSDGEDLPPPRSPPPGPIEPQKVKIKKKVKRRRMKRRIPGDDFDPEFDILPPPPPPPGSPPTHLTQGHFNRVFPASDPPVDHPPSPDSPPPPPPGEVDEC